MIDSEKTLKLRTQATIQAAIRTFRGGMHVEPPRNVIAYDSYGKLDRQQIDQGVIALVFQLNLSGGSVANMDLYKLLYTYLKDEGARTEINKIVDRENF